MENFNTPLSLKVIKRMSRPKKKKKNQADYRVIGRECLVQHAHLHTFSLVLSPTSKVE